MNKTIRLYVGGKFYTREEFKQKFADLGIAANPTFISILNLLKTAQEPLTVDDIAEELGKNRNFIAQRLKQLEDLNLIAGETLGAGRIKFYALTEKGLEFTEKEIE